MSMRIDEARQHHSTLTVVDQRSRQERAPFNILSRTHGQYLSICAKHCGIGYHSHVAHVGAAQRSTAGGNRSDELTDIGQQKRAIANLISPLFRHGNLDLLLAREASCLGISGISVSHNANPRIIGEHPLDAPRHLTRSIRDCYLPRVLRVSDADPTTVMD